MAELRSVAPPRLQSGVIGAGVCDAATAERARRVGRHIARRGHVLLTGGLGGVMAAASHGAHAAGGLTIGVLPGPDRDGSNPHLDVAIATNMGHARNVILAHSAHALIAISGEHGTLSEIAIALKHGLPVVGLQTWSLDRGALFDRFVPEARTAEEAVTMALTLAEEQRQRVDAGVEEDDESETPHSGPVRPPPTDEEA